MDILDFIKSMTIWNWLSLISFLILPFTALNLYYNLHPRFKDWRAIRSQKAFEKRITKLNSKFYEIQESRKSLMDLATKCLFEFSYILLCITGSLGVFFACFLFFAYPEGIGIYLTKIITFLLMIISIGLISAAIFIATEFLIFAHSIYNPFLFAEKTIQFINKGSKKLSLNPNNIALTHTILSSELFTVGDKKLLGEMIENYKLINK